MILYAGFPSSLGFGLVGQSYSNFPVVRGPKDHIHSKDPNMVLYTVYGIEYLVYSSTLGRCLSSAAYTCYRYSHHDSCLVLLVNILVSPHFCYDQHPPQLPSINKP